MERLGPGARIGGYQIVALLGTGGMGAVYRARDAAGREVALKLLGAEPNDATRERFALEARAAARVSHPNVARVHASGEAAGHPFIVFELVPGGTLSGLLKARGPLPWREAARLGADLARGLDAIHAAGLVHRDLKPANVLLDEEGRAKLADFGVVRSLDARSLTQTGEVLGTPQYMAPEQADQARAVDHRADLYSLGATLYAALVGKPPFAGSNAVQVVLQIMKNPPPSPRESVKDVPPALDQLIVALLARDPAARPRSARAVASDLDAILRGESRASPAASKEGIRPRGARRPLLLAAGALALAAAAAFIPGRLASGPKVVAPPPEDPRVLEALAAGELRENALDKAKEHAARAVALDAKLARAWAHLAVACARRRETDEASEAAQRALALDATLGEPLAATAVAHTIAHEWSAAVTDATAALARDPQLALAHAVLGVCGFWRFYAVNGGDAIDAARGEGKQAHALDPELGLAWIALGLAAWDQNDGAELRRCAEEAKLLEPQNPWSWFLVAEGTRRAPWDTDKERDALTNEAQAAYAKALELAPREALIWALRADHDMFSNRYDAALADAAKAIELDPKTPAAWLVRALIFHGMGRLDEAKAAAETLLEIVPDHAWAVWVVGDVLFQRGKVDEAIDLFWQSTGKDELYVESALSLANALVKRNRGNDVQDALDYLDVYLGRKKIDDYSRSRAKALRDKIAAQAGK